MFIYFCIKDYGKLVSYFINSLKYHNTLLQKIVPMTLINIIDLPIITIIITRENLHIYIYIIYFRV